MKDGITIWIGAWKERGWKTAARKPVKNQDLWLRLEAALAPHQVAWHWVRGHAGHDGNERADALARAAVPTARPLTAEDTENAEKGRRGRGERPQRRVREIRGIIGDEGKER